MLKNINNYHIKLRAHFDVKWFFGGLIQKLISFPFINKA